MQAISISGCYLAVGASTLSMLPDRRRRFLRPEVPPPTPLPFDPTSLVGERTDVPFDDVWFPGTVVAVNSPRAHAFAYTVAFDASAADVRTQIHKAESSKDVGVARRLATSGSSASVTST